VPRFPEQDLQVEDPPLGEASLAIAEVQSPKPTEALVVAELRKLARMLGEPPSPAPQRLDLVGREILEADDL